MISQKLLPLFQQDFDLDRTGQKQLAARHADIVRKIVLNTTRKLFLKVPENVSENPETISSQIAEIPESVSEIPEMVSCPVSEQFPENPGAVQKSNSTQSRANSGDFRNLAPTAQTDLQVVNAVYQLSLIHI